MASNPFGGRLRKVHTFYGNVVKQEDTFRAGDLFIDAVEDSPPTCANGHLMRTTQEVGAMCYCGSWLCVPCSQLRCALCSVVVCRKHAEIDGDRVICLQHSVWRRLWFFLLRQ